MQILIEQAALRQQHSFKEAISIAQTTIGKRQRLRAKTVNPMHDRIRVCQADQLSLLKIRDPLVPPNPKELDRTEWIGIS